MKKIKNKWNSYELTDLFENLNCSIYLCAPIDDSTTDQIILRSKDTKDDSRLEIYGVVEGKKLSEAEQGECVVDFIIINDDDTKDASTKNLSKEVFEILWKQKLKVLKTVKTIK